jgi:hypothetical protein
MNLRSLAGYSSIAMSLLTALAAAPYTLGEVATIIPPAWKEKVFVASAIATVILRIIRDNVAVVKDSLTTEKQLAHLDEVKKLWRNETREEQKERLDKLFAADPNHPYWKHDL